MQIYKCAETKERGKETLITVESSSLGDMVLSDGKETRAVETEMETKRRKGKVFI